MLETAPVTWTKTSLQVWLWQGNRREKFTAVWSEGDQQFIDYDFVVILFSWNWLLLGTRGLIITRNNGNNHGLHPGLHPASHHALLLGNDEAESPYCTRSASNCRISPASEMRWLCGRGLSGFESLLKSFFKIHSLWLRRYLCIPVWFKLGAWILQLSGGVRGVW